MAKKTILSVVILVFVVIGALFFIAREPGTGSRQSSKVIAEGGSAPDFHVTTLDGRSVSLSAFKGKVVMVHFWATWCPPCVEEIPTLDRLYRTFFGKDLEILAVSVDDNVQAVGSFVRKYGLSLPVYLDPERSSANLYGTFKFPETYLIDRGGVVRSKTIGARDWSSPDSIQYVQSLLDKK